MSGPANLGRRRRGWISTPSVHSIDSTYTCVHSLTNYSCLIGMILLSKFTRIASTTWFEVKNKSIINQAAAISFVKLFVCCCCCCCCCFLFLSVSTSISRPHLLDAVGQYILVHQRYIRLPLPANSSRVHLPCALAFAASIDRSIDDDC